MSIWIQAQTGASAYEILNHLKTNRPTVCIYCKENKKTMINLRHHISACWMTHGITWKEEAK